MSQGSLNVPTTGPSPPTTFAGIINGAADALVSKNSGATAPANFPTSPGAPTAFQDWADTSPGGGLVDEREYDGSNWLNKGAQDQTNHVWMPKVGGGSGSIAAAATTDIGSVRQSFITVTGAVPGTPITSFGSNALLNTGETRFLYFSAAGILTFNGASMILPGRADLPFNVGDTIQATYLGGGNWICFDFRSNISPAGRNTGDMFDKWGSGTISGAVRVNGNTIGNGASGATERANADTVNLFIMLYVADTALSVSGGRTAPGNTRAAAITDFNLNKTLTLPTRQALATKAPTRQTLLSGTGLTYTTPAGCVMLIARFIGGGGGGIDGGSPTVGGTTTWNGVNAVGGGPGGAAGAVNGGIGGTGGTGSADFRLRGAPGDNGEGNGGSGGHGGGGIFGLGGGQASTNSGGSSTAGFANSGAGGGGKGAGGGGGEYCEVLIQSPAATYTYTVGAGGSAGAGASAAGGSGLIVVDEYYGETGLTHYMAL